MNENWNGGLKESCMESEKRIYKVTERERKW